MHYPIEREQAASGAGGGRQRSPPRRGGAGGRALAAPSDQPIVESGMTTIAEACRAVLLTAEPRAKVKAARAAARAWRRGALAHDFDAAMPDAAGAAGTPELLPPNRMPKRGKAGSERSRIAMLHALAHIEFGAIDLAFDMAGRFGAGLAARLRRRLARRSAPTRRCISPCSTGGCARSARAMARCRRMTGCGRRRRRPRTIVLARLAVVPMVLEARGLDVTPAIVAAFERAGDARSAAILSRIYRDEIRHVAAGTRWFAPAANPAESPPVPHWQTTDSRAFPRER